MPTNMMPKKTRQRSAHSSRPRHRAVACSRAERVIRLAVVAQIAVLCTAAPLLASPPRVADLSTQEQVAQMVFPRLPGTLLTDDDPRYREVADLVREGRVGGVILFGGDPLSARSTVERLQALAPYPLLMGLDAEWGIGMRFEGGLSFPVAMAMGAADDEGLVEQVGRWTAREAMSLGIHLVLAPVLDLAVEPDNRVIGTRSFGGDPQRVAELGAAFVRGVQAEGAMAVVKHFPGHGATVEDSHYDLPHLSVDLDTLASRELVPFRAAVEVDVAGVMPAHIVVEALDGDTTPASRSAAVLTDVLRGDFGYDGLIISDALDMAGARGAWHGSVAVEAVRAGTDVLLLPPHPRVALDAVTRAVDRGDLDPDRVADAAGKILAWKERLGLWDTTESGRSITTSRGDAVALQRELARRAVTWLEADEAGSPAGLSDGMPGTPGISRTRGTPGLCLGGEVTTPRTAEGPRCWRGDVLVISLRDEFERDPGPRTLAAELRRRGGSVRDLWVRPSSVNERDRAIRRAIEEVDAVLVASYATRRSWGPIRSPEEGSERADDGRDAVSPWQRVQSWIEAAEATGRPTVLAAFDDPWVLRLDARTRLGIFDGSPAAQAAVVAAIHGETAVTGRVPVDLGVENAAQRREWEPVRWSAEPISDATTVGMASKTPERLRKVLRRALRDDAFPGAVALVARRGRVVFHEAVGTMTYDRGAAPVTRDTVYDLASLTKVVATTTVAMRLVERGVLDLMAPVRRYVPEFQGEGTEDIAVIDLLTHSSGLLWWTDLWARHGRRGTPHAATRAAYLEEIVGMPLNTVPRSSTEYSDLGLLLFGEIVARVTGRDFEEVVRREVLDPLGMDTTGYRPTTPPLSLPLERIAPTEIDETWRGGLVHGEVHDENAAGLGGVAPHAGLFSTAADLGRFLQAMLNGGHLDGTRLLRSGTIDRFTERAERVEGSSRAIGWDTPAGRSTAGEYFSADSYGHTGFTGTSLWVDPEREVVAVLLTNRVHPTRENRKISAVRRAFHDAIMLAIEDEEIERREP